MQPFASGGLTYLVSSQPLLFPNAAAGVDYWATPKAGLRFEGRLQYPSMMTFRCGAVFR